MNLNDKYMYVFVRHDLLLFEQLVAVGHCGFSSGWNVAAFNGASTEGIPNFIVIGVPDEEALARVDRKLRLRQLPAIRWVDPDCKDMGVRAIATVPLDDEQRYWLKNYRLWNENNNVNSPSSALSQRTEGAGNGGTQASMPEGEPVCPPSSIEAEHRPLRSEVPGSIPGEGSITTCGHNRVEIINDAKDDSSWEPPVCC